MSQRSLTDLERRMLDFADRHPQLDNAEAAIGSEFGWRKVTKVTYVAALFRLIDEPRAERERPLTVHRLYRVRDQRRSARLRSVS